MDNRRLILAMLVMTAFILGWSWFVNYMYERHPEWRRPGQEVVEQVTPDTTTISPSTAPVASTQPATGEPTNGTAAQPAPTAPSIAASGLQVRGVDETKIVELGSDVRDRDNPYRMKLVIHSTGAGLASVTLNEFDAAEGDDDGEDRPHYIFQEPFADRLNATQPLATRTLVVNGQTLAVGAVNWSVIDQTDNSVSLGVELVSGGQVVGRVIKTFTLARSDDPSLGYEVQVRQRLENLSDQPLEVLATLNGVVPPVREMFSTDDRQIIVGYNDEGRITVRSHMLAAVNNEQPKVDLTTYDEARFAWFGASSVYFAAIVRPEDAGRIANVTAEAINPQSAPDDRLVMTQFATVPQTVAAGGADELDLHVFLGPKQRKVLNSAYYYAFPLSYNKTLATLSSACSNVCTADWIINSLVWLLRMFQAITRDWGLAIICLVVLVRLILHPITKRSTISMHKMGKMGPEIERLKKKYGDNREELNKAMMELYKEQGATPILGCLPMFLQMPIWIALFSALQNTFELRQAPFLYGLLWIDDLSKPDAILSWSPIPLIFGFKLAGLNLLPILMAVVFFLQQKFTPKPPATTPEQQQQQKMMQFMTLLFPLFLYNGPSGLNLYILTSTTIGIIEMRRIRAHIKEREEAEARERPVIVDAGPTRGSKRLAKTKQRTAEEPPKRGLAKWLASLQEKAEQLQREAERRQREKGR